MDKFYFHGSVEAVIVMNLVRLTQGPVLQICGSLGQQNSELELISPSCCKNEYDEINNLFYVHKSLKTRRKWSIQVSTQVAGGAAYLLIQDYHNTFTQPGQRNYVLHRSKLKSHSHTCVQDYSLGSHRFWFQGPFLIQAQFVAWAATLPGCWCTHCSSARLYFYWNGR